MLTENQIARMLKKLERFESTLEPYLFRKVDALEDCRALRTTEQHHSIPEEFLLESIEPGFTWGSQSEYCWFVLQYTVPKALAGKDLFIRPHIGGYEAMLWVNGEPFGTFNSKIVFTGHGNHYCNLLVSNAQAGQVIDIALEYYAGHDYKGCAPLEQHPPLDYTYTYTGVDICAKNYAINEFYFDLHTLNELVSCLPEESFRRAQVINLLYKAHQVLYYSPEDTDWQTFTAALEEARVFLKQALESKNAEDAPFAALIGHSHMDTAWLWHVDETIKKCARTYSNQLSLMEQYPEYKFIQSSACHSNMIREHYPSLFKRIQQQVENGRYEPNGGVWVECDCNITGGESMVRQFLWGQRFARQYFNYTANCFWLPDTFGYSAAIPQIMKGCGVEYFLTTKISWNDTNEFPLDTFYWQGIDGTRVFTHFNRTHMGPDAGELYQYTTKAIKERTVTNRRLLSYGYGDGGGGPQFEMIEAARRCEDLNGIPRSRHMLVGDFMRSLENSAENPATYTGELYLELHRGTLTNQHTIKRNNRKAELALRDLEYFTVAEAVRRDAPAKSDVANPLYETLLLNQFHDILPGTCIPRAHRESIEQTTGVIAAAREKIGQMTASNIASHITLTNTLSFERRDPMLVDCPAGYHLDGNFQQQRYLDLDGSEKLIVTGLVIPAFSSVSLSLAIGEPEGRPAIALQDGVIETPYATVTINEKGYLASFIDKALGRELVDGYALNTFLVAEDLPSAWDNWDVDADLFCKFKDSATLLSQEVVSQGAAALVLRSKYQLTPKSTITQDMFFFAGSREVRFDTRMDWQDDHRFLKAAFDTAVQQDFARHEVQFGYVRRPTTRNNSIEKAKFEVLNHKYTDLSEARFGVSILNDCKYGISAEGGKLWLSLHKGGTRPDFHGDHGVHRCTYAFLPHNCGFHTKAVVRPAYMLNVPVVQSRGDYAVPMLLKLKADNIIAESIKPCEDSERAFIVRLYEAEGAYTHCEVEALAKATRLQVTNMLEEVTEDLGETSTATLTFKPFEIKTLKISY